MTQSSSRPRVKKEGIGDEVMKELFESFKTAEPNEFRAQCQAAIEKSSGSISTKQNFTDLLDRCSNKSSMLTKVTNYFLAGEGKGV